MPPNLTAEHIEQISRIAVAPVERLLSDRLDRFESMLAESAAADNKRLMELERRVASLENVRLKLFGIASAAGIIAGVAWTLLKDWFWRAFIK